MLFLWDCNCPSILLCSVLLIQLESLVLCAFGSSTMMGIAILVLEYCKHKHGQVRGFCTILTRINDIDKEYQVQRNSARTLNAVLMCKNDYYQFCTWGTELCMLLDQRGFCCCMHTVRFLYN